MPSIPKQRDWEEIVQGLLADVTLVEVPYEATPQGQLKQHLEYFVTSKVQAKTREEMLLGKPWCENGVYYFRIGDFLSYLDRQKFKMLQLNYVTMHLKEWGAQNKFFNLRGKGVNTLMVTEKVFQKQTEEFVAPETLTKKPFE